MVCAIDIPSVVLLVAHIDICWAALHQKLGRCLFSWSVVPHTSVELLRNWTHNSVMENSGEFSGVKKIGMY